MSLRIGDKVIISNPSRLRDGEQGTLIDVTTVMPSGKVVYTVEFEDAVTNNFWFDDLRLQAEPETLATLLHATADDPLETQEFYELMQSYRHCPRENQSATCQYFNQVKDFIRKHKANL